MQNIQKVYPQKIVLVLVGLPARGKSYISKKIDRFMNWLGYQSQIYNIGNYRRKYMADHNLQLTNDFFNPQNIQFAQIRQQIASKCLKDLIRFINTENSKVAIFDGTNSNPNRRFFIAEQLKKEIKYKYQLIFIQSICDDKEVIANNIKKAKIYGLDFKGLKKEQATQDFQARIAIYQKTYQPLSRSQGYSYIKTINVGDGVQIFRINGYLAQKIMTFTINLTISPKRKIYLTRHGESQYNIENRIGGDPKLSYNGFKYAKCLPNALEQLIIDKQEKQKITILTSTLQRTRQTAENIVLNDRQPIQLTVLDELNAGKCENMTYEQIEQKFPEIAKERSKDKLKFRYPSGQSYLDVIGRLQPLIYWLERQKYSILIVGHQAVLRCISAYFFKIQLQNMPNLNIPLHKFIRLTPQTYTFREEYVHIQLETGKILQLQQQIMQKYSIEQDGSQIKQKHMKKFPKVKSALQ